MDRYPNIAFVGKQGSGKTTLAKVLVQNHRYHRWSWADPIRQIFELAYGPIGHYPTMKATKYEVRVNGRLVTRTGGELLQLIGTEAMRDQVDEDFWIKAALRRMSLPRLVNDDTRFVNESDALRQRGWLMVRVEAPDEVRYARLGDTRRPESHKSESQQDLIEPHVVLDNGDETAPEALIGELFELIRELPEDWAIKGLDKPFEVL